MKRKLKIKDDKTNGVFVLEDSRTNLQPDFPVRDVMLFDPHGFRHITLEDAARILGRPVEELL